MKILEKIKKNLVKLGLSDAKIASIMDDIQKEDEVEDTPVEETKVDTPVEDSAVEVEEEETKAAGDEATEEDTENSVVEDKVEEKVDNVVEEEPTEDNTTEDVPPTPVEEPTPAPVDEVEETPVEMHEDDTRLTTLEQKYEELKEAHDGLVAKMDSFLTNLQKAGLIDIEGEEPAPVGIHENSTPSQNEDTYSHDDIISRLNRGRGY